jgi:signal transduction histidine kinase
MKLSLRNRLLAVALLGVFSCTVTLFGLGRIVQLTVTVRFERARDAVGAELGVMRRDAPSLSSSKPWSPARVATLGMRGGYVAPATPLDLCHLDFDAPTQQALEGVVRQAEQSHELVLRDGEGEDPLIVYGAAPTHTGSTAWIAYSVKPPTYIGMWRFIIASLSVATLLLVGTAISTVVSVRRGAAALNASLAALAGDLAAPVPRPPVPELADLADHIAGLAGALAVAQADKERLGAELAQRDRLAALGRVAAGVAHEVRNPLASIKLRVDLGRMRPDTPGQLAGELASVSEEITRLDRLVADLLVVAGRRKGPRTSTALGTLVEQRVGLLSPWASERGVTIQVTGSATCALDADAVARAVDNLVRNAVEASPAGTSVEVQVTDGDQGTRVRVLDHGKGVDDTRAPELFEPFFTTKPDGTGLGLALSRAIAAAHGGTLTYARSAGVTCFELSFPPPSSRGAGSLPADRPGAVRDLPASGARDGAEARA